MKYLKPLLVTACSLGSLLMINNGQAAPYLSIQGGKAKDNSGLVGRIGAGVNWGATDVLKIGMEIGGQGYGKRSRAEGWSHLTTKRKSLDGLAIADLYLTERFDLFVKGGAAYVNPKAQIDIGDEQGIMLRHETKSDHYFVPKGVLGLGYNVSDSVNLNLSLNHEFPKNSENRSMTSVLAGIQYQFC